MRGTIKEKIGPYDGPYVKNLITFKIATELGVLTWHEDGKRGLKDSKIGETYDGFEVTLKSKFDYRKSKLISTQLKLEL